MRGQSKADLRRRHLHPTRQCLALLALVLLALALRITRLDGQSFWYDEGVTAQVASQGLAELTRWTADDIQPPLYYVLVAGWMKLAGRSEWALRFPSAFFGVLTVPLLYALGRRLFDQRAALLAALLAALSPLYVYYAQEARMYTLLTFLGALAGYLLLRILVEKQATRRRWLWAACTLTAIAALYTHYFAAFLLAPFALYFLLTVLPHAPRSPRHASPITPHVSRSTFYALLLKSLIAILAIALAYIPWLPAMLTRFRMDASYWRGTLKLDEALRHVLISFSLGETVLEAPGAKLAIGYLAILVLCLVSLAARGYGLRVKGHGPQVKPYPLTSDPYPLIFLLLYLLTPLALILLLSYRNPKFNPRYLMLASPAFLLLIAGGLSELLSPPYPLPPIPSVARTMLVLCLTYIVGTSAYSIHNWFTDPAFTKADFRAVARYVREHIAPDETVILTSGHLSPVWDTYAPDVKRHRLPDMDILDVNVTLGYHSADDLNRILTGQRGVWTVLWQDEVVDPNGFLHDFLKRAGEEQPVERSFWHVGLRHYRLPEGVRFSSEPPIEHPRQANFGGQVALLGWSQEASDSVTLYWQALTDMEQDFKVALALEDTAGHTWGHADLRPAAYTYPTFRWRPGEVLFGRYDLPAGPGTPPGSHGLRVGLYDEADVAGLDVLDEAGNPRGKRIYLEGIQLSQLSAGDALTPVLALPGGRQTDVTLTEGLRLLSYAFDPAPLRPGDERTLDSVWQAETALPDVTVRWRWLDEAGHVLDEDAFAPGVQGQPGYPTCRWSVGDIVRSQTTLFLPPDAIGNRVTLELTAFVAGQPAGEPVRLLDVDVEVPPRVWEVPAVQVPVEARFDSLLRLVGLDQGADVVTAGATLPVTVTWQAIGDLASWKLTGFVHLLASDGRVLAQEDHVPQRGQRPTRGWLQGEVVADRYDLSLPLDLPPGVYRLEIGLYLDDGTRLVVSEPQAWQGRDSVLAGEIRVE